MTNVVCECCRVKIFRCGCLEKGKVFDERKTEVVVSGVFGPRTVSPSDVMKTPSTGNGEYCGFGMMENSYGNIQFEGIGEELMAVKLKSIDTIDLNNDIGMWMDRPGYYLELLMEKEAMEQAMCEEFMTKYVHQEMFDNTSVV
jgi:hypothetical protein